jgi:hypothetical protein
MEQSDRDKLREKFFRECVDPGDERQSSMIPRVNLAPHNLFEWFMDNLPEEHTPGSPSVEEIEKVLDDHAKNSDYDEVPDVGILEGDFYTVAKSIHDLSPEERPVVTELKSHIEQLKSKHKAWLGTEGEVSRQAFKSGLSWGINSLETILSLIGNKEEGEDTAQERYDKACVALRDSRMGIMNTEEEEKALKIAAGLTK